MQVLRLLLVCYAFLSAIAFPLAAQDPGYLQIRKQAEDGYPASQHILGLMYAAGLNVPKDHVEAVKWYLKSAEQGYAEAQVSLGFVYRQGLGVPKNDSEALKWYRKAADKESATAQFILGSIYADGVIVPRDRDEAVKWYRKSADQGYVQAQHNLGSMYLGGEGLPKDASEAYAWFNLAAISDDVARMKRDLLEKNLTPEQRTRAQQRSTELQKQIEERKKASGM